VAILVEESAVAAAAAVAEVVIAAAAVAEVVIASESGCQEWDVWIRRVRGAAGRVTWVRELARGRRVESSSTLTMEMHWAQLPGLFWGWGGSADGGVERDAPS